MDDHFGNHIFFSLSEKMRAKLGNSPAQSKFQKKSDWNFLAKLQTI